MRCYQYHLLEKCSPFRPARISFASIVPVVFVQLHGTNLVFLGLKLPRHLLFYHCVKSVRIRSYFWSIFSCIRTEYRKIAAWNNSVFCEFRLRNKFKLFPKFSKFYTESRSHQTKEQYHQLAPWWSGYHYCTTSFKKVWTRLSAGSNLARGVSEICDGENLWEGSGWK